MQVQTADWSTVEPTADDALCPTPPPPGHFCLGDMSQTIHHGQKVISFAAGTGRLVSRLGELSHDLGQLSIGLLVLEDNVIHQSQCWSGHRRLHLIRVNPV